MENTVGLENRHVLKIAGKMAPNPSRWRLAGYVKQDGECACGQKHILHQFILCNRDDEEKHLVIGSTCIDATVPWLIAMDAGDLAEALQTEWKRIRAEIERVKSLEKGMMKLRLALPLAVAMDEWFENLEKSVDRTWWLWPEYWEAVRSGKRRLQNRRGSTPAQRASATMQMVANYRERIPLLHEAFKQKNFGSKWIEPPADVDVPDGWLEARLEAEPLFETLNTLHDEALDDDLLSGTEQCTLKRATKGIPFGLQDMSAWTETAQAMIALLQDETELKRRRREAKRRMKEAEAERKRHEAEAEAERERQLAKHWLQGLLWEREEKLALKTRAQQRLEQLKAACKNGMTVQRLTFSERPNPRSGEMQLEATVGSVTYVVNRRFRQRVWCGFPTYVYIERQIYAGATRSVWLVQPLDDPNDEIGRIDDRLESLEEQIRQHQAELAA